MKNIETILNRLIENPQFNGNMVEDTQAMYEETDQNCTFEWTDSRSKPTWSELEAEYLVYLKEIKTEAVEEEKRNILNEQTVTISNSLEVWNRDTKIWETKSDVKIITDGNSKNQLNVFAHRLSKDALHEKTNWKNNGDKIKLNATSYGYISDAMEISDDLIFDWVSDKLDEINDATTEAEIEAINTTYS